MQFYLTILLSAVSLIPVCAMADGSLAREIKVNQYLHKLSSATEAALAHDVEVDLHDHQVGRQLTRQIVLAREALALEFDVVYLYIPDHHVAEELVEIAGLMHGAAEDFDDVDEELHARALDWRGHHDEVRSLLRGVDQRLAALIQISNEHLSTKMFSRRSCWENLEP